MRVIGVVGLPASGKGEVSRLARTMGIPVVVMGDVIRTAVIEAGQPVTDQNLGEMSGKIREADGMGAIASLCIPVIESQGAGICLVDGIRSDAEVEIFRKHFNDFILIGVDASFSTRLWRLSERGRSDDSTSSDELERRDRREIGWGLSRALEKADYTLVNEGSLEDFITKAGKLLGELGIVG